MFAAIADELVDAEAVDGQAAERPDDRAGGLEPEREDADQEVARGDQLGLARPASSRIRVELGEHVDDRRDGDLGVDRGPRRERPGAPAHVEPGPGAVGVALLLAQLHVQPRVEQPAEDRAHDRDRVEVVDPARQAAVADPDLGLDRARPMDDADDAPDRRARCRRSARPGADPRPRRASTIRTAARRAPRRPGRRGRRRPRASPGAGRASAVDRAEVGRGQALDRLARPAGRPVVGRLPARRSSRRTPPRRAGAGRPGPGGGRSGARRAGARPRTPGRSAGGGPRPRARGPAPSRAAGTSTPTRQRRPSRPRRGARRRAARTPRPGRSRRSARCPRSGRGPPGRSRRPGRPAPRRRRR